MICNCHRYSHPFDSNQTITQSRNHYQSIVAERIQKKAGRIYEMVTTNCK